MPGCRTPTWWSSGDRLSPSPPPDLKSSWWNNKAVAQRKPPSTKCCCGPTRAPLSPRHLGRLRMFPAQSEVTVRKPHWNKKIGARCILIRPPWTTAVTEADSLDSTTEGFLRQRQSQWRRSRPLWCESTTCKLLIDRKDTGFLFFDCTVSQSHCGFRNCTSIFSLASVSTLHDQPGTCVPWILLPCLCH